MDIGEIIKDQLPALLEQLKSKAGFGGDGGMLGSVGKLAGGFIKK